MSKFDVRVLGSGSVSRALGLALARQGLAVALDAKPAAPAGGPDVRAYALNAAAVNLLTELRAWDALPADARTPVYDMQVDGDASGSLAFSAWQQTVSQLAWIVDAAELEQVLETAVRFAPSITVLAPPAPSTAGAGAEDAAATAALTVVAEGKASARREGLGVRFERHPYGHTALAARLVADRPHAGTARQWFRQPDILALLPFDRPQPGQSYGLVWSLPAAEAEAMAALPVPEFEAALNEATHGVAGRLALAGERATWPLMHAHARSLVGPGWALVGDAAHVVHPLAGQGLNLGLADVQALAAVIAAREPWRSLGDEALLRRYARARLVPTRAMAGMVDGLWQLFSISHPVARELRNRGMTLVNQLPPVKRWLVGRALDA